MNTISAGNLLVLHFVQHLINYLNGIIHSQMRRHVKSRSINVFGCKFYVSSLFSQPQSVDFLWDMWEQ